MENQIIISKQTQELMMEFFLKYSIPNILQKSK